jgi:hypothetical protein
MKKVLLLTMLVSFIFIGEAQTKKDGRPDMRYKANKEPSSNYFTPNSSAGTNSSTRYQDGYIKTNGTYVEPHMKTTINSTNTDNFSTKDNTNVFTGTNGTRAKDYSPEANNYGQGQQIQTGSKGGQFYINNSGKKIYVPKQY